MTRDRRPTGPLSSAFQEWRADETTSREGLALPVSGIVSFSVLRIKLIPGVLFCFVFPVLEIESQALHKLARQGSITELYSKETDSLKRLEGAC